jgi:hypothetical protein
MSAPVEPFVTYLLEWVLRSVKDEARFDGRRWWMAYGVGPKSVMWFSAVLLAALVIGAFLGPPKDRVPLAIIAAFFALPTIAMILEFQFVRIGFDEETIECRSGWRIRRSIPWSSVRSCSYSAALMWWVIDAGPHGKIRVHQYLSGQRTFFAVMKKRTGVSARVAER